MASPDAELKVRIDAELAAGFLTAFKTGAKIPKEFADKVDSELKRAAAAAKSLGDNLGGGFAKGSNQAAFALTNLGRVAQDAPFGFIGIQNNLNPLLESFQRLKVETGSSSAALKALGLALTGPAGIGIALSVVSAAILFWPKIQAAFTSSNEAATKSLQEERDEFTKSPFEKASSDLAALTENVKLAKEGFLSKKEVLKQYNEGIGQTIGKVTSLDDAEQKLVKNGDAYLRLMLLKANAEFAFKKAAEESYNLSKKQLEIDSQFKPNPNFDINRDRTQVDIKPTLLSMDELGKRIAKVSQGVDEVKKKAVIDPGFGKRLLNDQQLAEFQGQATKAVDIAKSAQQQIIDFAKQNGFDINKIFGTDSKSGAAKDIKTISDVFKELNTQLLIVDNTVTGTFASQDKDRINAYQKAMEDLLKMGVNPVSVEIGNLQGKILQLSNEMAALPAAKFETKLDGGITGEWRGLFENLPTIAFQAGTKATESILSPLQAFENYIGTDIFPKLQSGFETFFNDILEKGTFSFGALGQAILKTFTSVLASEATRGILGLLNPAQTQLQKGGGGGLFGLIGGLFKGGAGAAGGTAATGGALLPILGGIAAAGLIASLFKKKKSDPYIAPAAVATSNASNVGSADFNSGRVVFEISGVNLVGVLNRAGAKLQRYNIV